MKRQILLDTLTTISPALATDDRVPALTHFWFVGDKVMAYDDAIAMSVPLKTEFKRAIPGKPLLSLLHFSTARSVEFIRNENELTVKAAGSKWRLETLGPEVFDIFQMPENFEQRRQRDLDKFLDAIECCMRSVNSDPSLPGQAGITLIPEGDMSHIYATNDVTISSVDIKFGLKLKDRVVLPESFCKQMLALRTVSENLQLQINAARRYALFSNGRVLLYGHCIQAVRPVDFAGVIAHHKPDNLERSLIAIPSKLREILDRAIEMMDATEETSTTTISVNQGKMTFFSKSRRGEVTDYIMNTGHPDLKRGVLVNPKRIKAGYGYFDRWLVTDQAVLMTKGDALYMIGVTSL
jgi:DNA polymerase III sliding clamp (beta) subunit (PCNA family)